MVSLVRPRLNPQAEEIRLIKVQPGEQQEAISCTFEIASLQHAPLYEALSYVWGDPKVTVPITINGCTYQVTTNLGGALRNVRKKTQHRLLWVDAICINQDDNAEKSQQVGMMREIYAKAYQCVIWLGDYQHLGFTETEAQAAFDVVKMLSEDTYIEIFTHLERAVNALEQLLISPWWSRIWTVQEIVLSSSAVIHWGSVAMEWSTFQKAAEVLVDGSVFNHVNLPFRMDRLPAVFKGHRFSGPIIGIKIMRNGNEVTRLDLLRRFRYREASDPRDKVFGLAGLLPSSIVRADYSLDVVQVYKQATIELIRSGNNLTPLIGRRGEERQFSDLPSWTVDWTRPKNPVKRWERYWDHIFRYGFYDADQSKDISLQVDDGTSTISLSGLLIDGIGLVAAASMQDKEELSDGNLPVGILQSTILRWQALAKSHFGAADSAYIGGGTWEDAFWRTMAGDLVTDGGHPQRRVQDGDRKSFDEFCQSDNPEDLEYGFELYDGLRSNIVNQAFFITTLGYIGIGPPMVERGDKVWVLFGGSVPFVLRPVTGGRAEDFTLIGDGYLHGIMNGEAVEEQEEKVQTVILH